MNYLYCIHYSTTIFHDRLYNNELRNNYKIKLYIAERRRMHGRSANSAVSPKHSVVCIHPEIYKYMCLYVSDTS